MITTYGNKYLGFNCFLSTMNTNCIDILQLYRDKNKVEKDFDDIKNTLDPKRLRVHDSISMNPRLFIQFITLIYISYIKKQIKSDKI
jgi:transposase